MTTSSQKLPRLTIALTLMLGLLAATLASGSFASGGGNGGGFIGGGASSAGPAPKREADERYEYGKAVYLGRLPDSEKLEYCVLKDGEAKKLKRRTLKPYRGKTLKEFANALYRCDDSTKLALNSLKREQVAFVLYYLNKRYRLKLS